MRANLRTACEGAAGLRRYIVNGKPGAKADLMAKEPKKKSCMFVWQGITILTLRTAARIPRDL